MIGLKFMVVVDDVYGFARLAGNGPWLCAGGGLEFLPPGHRNILWKINIFYYETFFEAVAPDAAQ